MIKRLISFVLFAALCCKLWSVNAETITLDRQNDSKTIELSGIKIKVELVSTNKTDVRVSVQNTSDYYFLLFKYEENEKSLKSYKPRVTFKDKSYPGAKGYRYVEGCNLLYHAEYILNPYENKAKKLFDIDVPSGTETTVKLHFYSAEYHKGGFLFFKKEQYKILRDHPIDLIIKVNDWDESDPTYQQTKKAVDDFAYQASVAQVCTNRHHPVPLEVQYGRYEAKRDSLLGVINKIQYDGWWTTDQKPGQKYNELVNKLNSIDIRKSALKVKKCPADIPPTPTCNLCKQYPTAEKLYKRLDSIYQQLYAGTITKDAAVSTAKSLYNCFKSHGRSDKQAYSSKIDNLYKRITEF